ncbi:MAG: biotin--[acetyl-CoA-carboxylase] ligase [Lachnospiraceae bacterium]|jgi:BirA family biotin operon repressor/biotin-[acetyl-CoA-carboxylase] ligase|nr:biotin--[acetyl-CoA-carboxylase] ligase [Lachnospiraceae bacterium]
MKTEILKLLRESGDYISGQELCSLFGVSRTAVWKVINQLKEEGYGIEAVQNKGYRLRLNPDVLSYSELKSRIRNNWAGSEIYYYEETGSTNIDAKRLGEEGAAHGTIVVADKQNAGRGRRGRVWQSPAGKDIYFTILLRPSFEPDKASGLTLVMALSVAQAVERKCSLKAGIKWPNDVVLNGKKICGILTEMNMETDYIQHVVIGVGINVNLDEMPEEISQTATSILWESGEKTARAELLQEVLARFEENYGMYEKESDLSYMLEEYNSYLVNVGKQVKVLDPKGEFEGIARGINASGELLIETPDGKVAEVYAGEVSVRGMYGYV